MENNQDETLNARTSQSATSAVENSSTLPSRMKKCACDFKMTEARWSLCRSIGVFCVGVVLTVQLQTVVHRL